MASCKGSNSTVRPLMSWSSFSAALLGFGPSFKGILHYVIIENGFCGPDFTYLFNAVIFLDSFHIKGKGKTSSFLCGRKKNHCILSDCFVSLYIYILHVYILYCKIFVCWFIYKHKEFYSQWHHSHGPLGNTWHFFFDQLGDWQSNQIEW